MASDLDRQMQAISDRLTGPGGPLETVPFSRFGQTLPLLKHAPPSLPALFRHFCDQHGDAAFLIDGDLRLTFTQTHAAASRLAQALIAGQGLARGERVGIAAHNSANWVIAYMAVLMAGGCATLLNGWWTAGELAEGIALAECRLVLADGPRCERLASASVSALVLPFAHGPFASGFAQILAAGGDAAPSLPTLAADDLATLTFTSGSTSSCKAAISDHRAVTQAAISYAGQSLLIMQMMTEQGTAPTGQPAALACVPFFHVTGEIPLLLQSLVIGRRMVIMAKWDAAEAMRLIEAERVSYFLGVPLMSFEIATHPDRARYDLSSCRHFSAGGAARPVSHVTRLREALPHAFPLAGYGLTETNAVGCGNFNENYLAKPGSAGTANRPLVDIAILDDAGQHLSAHTPGEVAIRSIANALGYWNNPEATAEAITHDGYFRTGDIGYMDGDGYLFIVDRKKDIVIRGGENITCLEVEQALYDHPHIIEASVFGLPDVRLGEIPVAAYVARPGFMLDEAELRSFLAARLAAYKIPQHFWQETDPFPRLGTEKIDKRALKQRYADRANAPISAADDIGRQN